MGTAFRSPFAVPVVAAVFLILHLQLGDPGFETAARLGGAALGILMFLIVREASVARLPFMALTAVTFYLAFGYATFSDQRLLGAYGPIFVSQEARALAVWSAFVALGVMHFVSPLGRRLGGWVRPKLARLVPSSNVLQLRGAIRLWAVTMLIARAVIILRWGRDTPPIAFIILVLSSPPLVQALLHAEFQASKSPVSKLWFWGYTIATSSVGLTTGMLVEVLVPIVAALVLQWLATGRVRVAGLVALVGVYLVLAPAKYAYRDQTWDPRGKSATQVTLSERATAWLNAIESSWGGDSPAISENVSQSEKRVTIVMYVGQTFEWVPAHVPHSGMSRWTMILYSYIPRVLWKNKPDLTRYYNGTYAITFDLITEGNTRTTAVGFSLMSDGYWAAGWPGIIFAAALVGLVLSAYEGAFAPNSWALRAIGFAFLPTLQPHGHLASVLTGIFQSIFALILALWVIWLLSLLLTQRQSAHAGELAS